MSCKFDYKINYSKRKSVLISINDMGEVLVKAPLNIDINEVEKILVKKEDWITNKINEVSNRRRLSKDTILYLGEEKKVSVNIQKYLKREFVMYYNDEFVVNVRDVDNVVSIMKKYLSNQCHSIVKDKINKFQKYFMIKPLDIKVKDVKTKWGSCSYDNKIVINYRLVMAKEEIIEYVVVHEMCHMIHKNHSKDYWNLVEKIYPNYKSCNMWLKENAYLLQLLHLQP